MLTWHCQIIGQQLSWCVWHGCRSYEAGFKWSAADYAAGCKKSIELQTVDIPIPNNAMFNGKPGIGRFGPDQPWSGSDMALNWSWSGPDMALIWPWSGPRVILIRYGSTPQSVANQNSQHPNSFPQCLKCLLVGMAAWVFIFRKVDEGHRTHTVKLPEAALCRLLFTSSNNFTREDLHAVAAPDIFFCRCYGGARRFSEGAMKWGW